MKTYTIISLDESHEPLSFMDLEDAEAFTKAFPNKWRIIEAKHVLHLNAQKYIDWKEIPNHLNFIYRDSFGVWASQYKPISKWYGATNNIYRLYGGERKLLEECNWHALIKLGDIFERDGKNTFHFIRWNTVKNAYALKFIDNEEQTVEVFNDQGELIFSGSNDDIKIVFKRGSFQFEKFPWQTYTFLKE